MRPIRVRRRIFRSLLLLTILSCLCAQPTRAESTSPASEAAVDGPRAEDVERARALFKKGVELARTRDFAGAAARFREALALHGAPAIQYNLAAALSQLSQHAEAFNLCQEVIRKSDAPQDVQAHCQKLQDDITPQTARLTVLASSASAQPRVEVDGVPLPDAQLGVPRALAPGVHRVTAERDQARFFEREVSIPLGSSALVDVSLIVTESVVVQKQVVEVARPDTQRERSAQDLDAQRKRRRRIWSAVAASIVAAGAGVAVAVLLSKPEPKTEAPVTGSLNPGVLTWK